MSDKIFNKKNIVFGLDIGTRSIVGSVGYLESNNKFNVIAHYSKEHETRAMMDGQIHDISKVSDTIHKVKNELEQQLSMPLKDVCIAAAGRVLKTVTIHVDYELNSEMPVSSEQIYSLDMLGVQQAYEIVRSEEEQINFYCVGYSIIKYYLNDFVISNLEGHKAKKISADVLATFLPEEVVDGLYASVETAGLQVANLTLEPIAAINIAIPQKFRLLNIALVDVGAGTSDISITKDGSIIAYGMIPRAGDEITESLVSRYLVEFNTAEKIKRASIMKRQISFQDIMGLKQKITPDEAKEAYRDTVQSITREIADKIIELNGGKSVSAVFVVGGGGKVHGFTKYIAEYLDIPEERVALRGEEVLTEVNFEQEGIKKDPLLVTPIGICLSYYEHKNNFIFVNVNGERIKLYDNDKLTVVDAALSIGFPNDSLFPKRGDALEFFVNGEKRMIRGEIGEPALISINGEEANINSKIIKNDDIRIKESTAGKAAALTIEKLKEYSETMVFNINGQSVKCPRFVQVNDELQSGDYQIQTGDKIEVLNYYTLKQLLSFMDIDEASNFIRVNNKEASSDKKVYENFNVDFEKRYYMDEQPLKRADAEESSTENVLVDNSLVDNELADNSLIDNGLVNNGLANNTDTNGSVTTSNANATDNSKTVINNVENNTTQNVNGVGNSSDKAVINDNTPNDSATDTIEIIIAVNDSVVKLKNKKQYIFVDILDFYAFDTRVAGGKELVMTINGEKCDFTSSLNDGDVVKLYWRN